jgi:hypothetical protein
LISPYVSFFLSWMNRAGITMKKRHIDARRRRR